MVGKPQKGFELPRILEDWEIRWLLELAKETRYPERNQAIVLLACDAGLSPREIALIRRCNVLTDRGVLGDHIDLIGVPRKRLAARRIPIGHKTRLWWAIHDVLDNAPGIPADPLIISERALEGGGATRSPGAKRLEPMRPSSISYIFWKLFDRAGIQGASARSGRATFIVRAGRKLRSAGASARDIQALAGHRSLETTQRFLEADMEAQSRVIRDLFEPLRE